MLQTGYRCQEKVSCLQRLGPSYVTVDSLKPMCMQETLIGYSDFTCICVCHTNTHVHTCNVKEGMEMGDEGGNTGGVG